MVNITGKILLSFTVTVIIFLLIFLLSSNSAAIVNNNYVDSSDMFLTASVRLDYGSREHIREYAKEKVIENFGEDQWIYFDKLVQRESSWDCNAQNPTSTAFGCMQFLNITWIGTGIEKTDNPFIQIDAGIIYISQRYKNPDNALDFWNENKWY